MNAITSSEARDDALEAEIDAAYQQLVGGKTEAEQREAQTVMAVLIRRRSSHQVMKMELERRIYRATK